MFAGGLASGAVPKQTVAPISSRVNRDDDATIRKTQAKQISLQVDGFVQLFKLVPTSLSNELSALVPQQLAGLLKGQPRQPVAQRQLAGFLRASLRCRHRASPSFVEPLKYILRAADY